MRNDHRIAITGAKGTIYFVESAEGLKQGYDLTIQNPGSAFEARLAVRWGKNEHTCDAGKIIKGESTVRVYIPDVREAVKMTFSLVGKDAKDLTIDHKPQRHWTVHLIQFAHHDPGYTDLPSSVMREMASFYDKILQFCAETDHFPEDSKFRYTIEQGYSLLYFLEHRPPEVCEEMIRRIKEGRIEVNAFLANEVTELLGPEEMVRMLYPVFALKRKYGIPVLTAEHNDIPGISWGVAAAMSGSGIKYFAPALPDYFGWHGKDYHGFWDDETVAPGKIPHAFYWEGPEGQKTLFWYGTQGAGGNTDITLAELPKYLESLEEKKYPYDVLRHVVMGAFRDNSPPSVGFAYTAKEWNSKWAYPKFVMSLNAKFFPELEKQLREDTPTWRGELPGTDYSASASCTAYPSSLNRVAHDWLLAAERLAAVASAITSYRYPSDAIKETYYCALMNDEHCWGIGHVMGPAQEACVAQHCEYAYRAAALAHNVITKCVNEIADHVKLDEEGYYAVMFNPLDRPRTDVAVALGRPMDPCEIWIRPLPRGPHNPPGAPSLMWSFPVSNRHFISIPQEMLEGGLEVIDLSTGKTVPHQVYEITSPLAPVPYASYRYSLSQFNPQDRYEVQFMAEDVPPMGYKVYRFVPAKKSGAKAGVKVGANTLESKFYKVELDLETGVIRSIYDKELKRELVDAKAEHGANQLVLRSSITSEVFTSGKATIEQGRTGPISGSLIVKTEAVGYPQITQEITLYSDIKRIDIANRALKDSTPQLETFFAFPFAFEKPKFKYEGSLCVIEPIVDQFPGSNSDYHAVQHWADVSDGDSGVTLCSIDAPIMQFGGNWPLYISQAHHGYTPPNFDHPFHTKKDVKKGHIYSFVLLNNYRTNFNPTQSGDLLFRYSITSHSGDWKKGKARDFGYGVSLPLIHAAVKNKRNGELPASSSWLKIDKENVLLLTLKRAEDGNGFIVRVMETEGKDTEVTITLPFFIINMAYETNLVEENQRIIPFSVYSVRVNVKAWGTATVRVVG